MTFYLMDIEDMDKQQDILGNIQAEKAKEPKIHLFAGGVLFTAISEILISVGFLESVITNKDPDSLVLGAGLLTLICFLAGWFLTKKLFIYLNAALSDGVQKYARISWIIFSLIAYAALNALI